MSFHEAKRRDQDAMESYLSLGREGSTMYNQPPYNAQPTQPTPTQAVPSTPVKKSDVERAFEVVRDILQLPSLTDNERIILQMQYVFGHAEADVCASLVMTPKEYRKTRSEAFLKAVAGDIRAKKHDG